MCVDTLSSAGLPRIILFALVTQILTGCWEVVSARSSGPSSKPTHEYYDDYPIHDYKHSSSNTKSGDYNYGSDVIDAYEDTRLLCYSCELTLLDDGHIEGYPNCNEPFRGLGLPQVQCDGVCSKKYEIKSKTSYTIRRNCLPNCRERAVVDKEYVKCCSTKLCNGYVTLHRRNSMNYLLMTSGAVLLVLLWSGRILIY